MGREERGEEERRKRGKEERKKEARSILLSLCMLLDVIPEMKMPTDMK
jgi:hypothetical protein